MVESSNTPTYNLKAVIQETGLRPDTLRAWERRYGMPHPDRTGGGHRLYSQRDIDTLKWLISRQHEGMSISRAVDLWRRLEGEGRDPLHQDIQEAPVMPAGPAALIGGNTVAELRQAWISACLVFDEQTAEHVIAQASVLYPVETVCFELLQKGLAYMGEGWYRGEVTVQQEHFTSALALRWVEALLVATPAPTRPGRILVACPADEEHTFSLLVMTLLLRRHGWKALYLGANVPIARLETTIAMARPQLVILAAQQLSSAATLLEMAQVLQRERVPLAFGGMVFNHIPALRSRIPGHFLGENLEQAPQVAEQLLAFPRPVPQVEGPGEPHEQALAHFQEQQPLIETFVWRGLHDVIPGAYLATANINFARVIKAALALGDIHFLGNSLSWVKGLLVNYNWPLDQLQRFLDVYYEAARNHLDERGQLIVDWLADLARNGAKP